MPASHRPHPARIALHTRTAYTLETLCGPRLGVSLDSSGGAGSELAGPLLRLRRGLVASAQLFETVRLRAQPWLRPEAVQVEMQVRAAAAPLHCSWPFCRVD